MSPRKPPLRLGLQARITALTVAGLTLVFVVVGFIGLRNQTASMDVVLQQRVALAETVAAHVEYHTGYMLDELAAAAEYGRSIERPDDLAPEQAALADLFRSGMFTYNVFVADARGVVLAVEPPTVGIVGADLSAHPHVLRALETGRPQVSGVISGVAVPGPLISLVVPVKNADGETVGLIGGALDPSGSIISGLIAPMALGETGYAQVMDGEGMVVASTTPGAAGLPSQHRDLILSLIQRGEATVLPDSSVTEEGQEFHEVIAFAPIPRFGWSVTVEQDRAEALAPVIRARNQIMAVAVIVLAVAMLFVWFTTRQVTEPVRSLSGAARRIAAGDLDTPVVAGGPDEVAELGRGFEAMRRKLAAWGEELEAAVQQRTRELSALHEAEQRRAARLADIVRLGTELATMREEGALLNLLVTRAAALANSPACTVSLVDEAAQEAVLAAQVGLPEGTPPGLRVPLSLPIIRRSLETGEPIILPDIDRNAPEIRQVLVRADIRAFFAYPMVWQGRAAGFITLSCLTPHTPSAQEIAAYQLLAERAAAGLENARLYRGLEESKAALEARVRDLERFTKHAVGRELMMKELKERIRELEKPE